MKRLWNLLRGKARKDNKGMTFVEVLCAVAILALVAGVIGTVIVMSTRTYRKGISETGIQQEAQLAANNIGNLVKDACTVKYGESGHDYMVNGEVYDEDGNPKVPDSTNPSLPRKQADGMTELSIITNDKNQYMVMYEKNDPTDSTNPYGKLKYREFDKDGNPKGDLQIMADNVIAFSADTTDFKKSKTIKLNMTVEDENTKRQIPMAYTMTSRNDAVEGAVFVSYTDNAAIRFMDDEVVLIPGETYKLQYVSAGVSGLPTVKEVKNVTVGALTTDYVEVTVPLDTDKETGSVELLVEDADGNEITDTCPILIRRVQHVEVTHVTDTKNSQGGMRETVGTVYTFSAAVSGHELVKHVAYDYDWNYKTAQAVAWSCVLKVNGTTSTYNWTSARNADHEWEFTAPDFETGTFAQYFKVDAASTNEDALVPSFAIEVIETMPADLELTVRATSKHALGWNKAMTKKEGDVVYPVDTKYYDAYGSDPKNVYYGEDTITPRETKLDQGLEIVLEPCETDRVVVDMKGGISSAVECVCNGTTDSGTIATYIGATPTEKAKVEITLGKDEEGSGYEGRGGVAPYTFTIDVKVNNETKTTITVHVRRVDYVHIDAVRNEDDNTTMDLRLRFNADTKVDNRIKYLIDGTKKVKYKRPDDTEYELPLSALTTRVTIEVVDKAGNVNESLTRIAEWKTYEGSSRDKTTENKDVITVIKGGELDKTGIMVWPKQLKITITDENGKKKDKVIYQIENTKPARILKNGSSWSLAQTPELDIKPMGLGAGEKIRVTMEALHPIGSDGDGNKTNNTEETYATGVKDVYELEGEEIIGVPKKDEEIIVEPYQVNNVSGSNGAMAIPLYTAKQVAAVKVKLEGQDSGTKVVNDTATGGTNSEWTLPVSGSSTNLLLNISPTEEGSTYNGKDGRIKMTLMAYSGATANDDELLDTVTVYLAVRRVTTVDIQNKTAFANETGKEIELKALASGIQGIEYFDRQVKDRDDKYEPVWDSADKYKSPYKLKWSLYYKDNKGKETEKEISNSYSEYFKDVSFGSANTDGSGAQTIKFTLTKALPEGAQIRATSVHAGNKNGKAENRSGLNYVMDKKYENTYPEDIVFDYIEVKSSLIVVDGFQRADDWDFASNNKWTTNDSAIPDMRKYFTDAIYDSKQNTFFRYKEAGTDWDATNMQYRMMDSDGARAAFFGGDLGSRLFLPNKEYELEIINVVYSSGSNGKKVIYWPQEEKLLDAGKGWAEEGYTLWDGTWGYNMTTWEEITPGNWGNVTRTYEEVYKLMKNTPQVKYNFLIPKSEVYFEKYENQWSNNFDTIDSRVKSIGSESNPKKLSHDVYYDRHFMVKINPTSMNIEKTQAHFTAEVDKWENGKWTFMEALTQTNRLDEAKYKWFMNVSLPTSDIYHIWSDASGKYRVRSTITGMEWTKLSGGLFDTGSGRYQKYVMDSIEMFNTSDGSGIMYLQLN